MWIPCLCVMFWVGLRFMCHVLSGWFLSCDLHCFDINSPHVAFVLGWVLNCVTCCVGWVYSWLDSCFAKPCHIFVFCSCSILGLNKSLHLGSTTRLPVENHYIHIIHSADELWICFHHGNVCVCVCGCGGGVWCVFLCVCVCVCVCVWCVCLCVVWVWVWGVVCGVCVCVCCGGLCVVCVCVVCVRGVGVCVCGVCECVWCVCVFLWFMRTKICINAMGVTGIHEDRWFMKTFSVSP